MPLSEGLVGYWIRQESGDFPYTNVRGPHRPDTSGIVPSHPDLSPGPGGGYTWMARFRASEARPVRGRLSASDAWWLGVLMNEGAGLSLACSAPDGPREARVFCPANTAPSAEHTLVVWLEGGVLTAHLKGTGQAGTAALPGPPVPAGGGTLSLGGDGTLTLLEVGLWSRPLSPTERGDLMAGLEHEAFGPPTPDPPTPQPPPEPDPPPEPEPEPPPTPPPPLPPTLDTLVRAFAREVAREAEARGAILERVRSSLSLGYEELKAELNRCLLDHAGEPQPVPAPTGGELVDDVSSQAARVVELVRQTGGFLGTLNARLEAAVGDALAAGATEAQLAPLGTVAGQLKGLAAVLEGVLTPPPGEGDGA